MVSKKRKALSGKNRVRLMLLAAFGCASLVLAIVYFITRILPFGTITILRMDLYHQYGPLFAELYERIANGDSLIYSWCSGLGSCFLGNYFNYMSSPIGAIVMLFGHNNVPEAIAAMILIKAGLSASSFNYYIYKSQKKLNMSTLAFGVMYAFCGYFLAYYWNVMWIDAMVLLPLVTYGIERIINNGKIRTYVAALALTMLSNYYMSFMMCIFSVIYFFAYFYSTYNNGAKLVAVDGDKPRPKHNSRFWRSAFKFAAGSLLAAGLIAFALVPTYLVLQATSATSGKMPDDMKLYFNLFDFLANHLAGLDTTIRSSGDVVLPNVFCGMLTVLLMPLYLMTKSISKKEKAVYLIVLGVFFIGFNFNVFNFLWHGMHFPNDLPYRQSFMYTFILLVMAYKTFIRLRELTSRQIALSGIGLILFIVIVQKVGSKNVSDVSVYISLFFTFFYTVLLIFFKDRRYTAVGLSALMLVCVCSESLIASTGSYDIDQPKANYASDLGDFESVKSYLDNQEGDEFYRMELSDLRTRMDPCWYYYNGVSIFSSMAYENTASLMHNLGMYGNTINSYTYYPQTPVFNSMFSLKYIVDNTEVDVLENNLDYYTYVTNIDKFTAYENDCYLPIGFCVNSDVSNWVHDSADPFEVQGSLFALATGTENPFYDVPISNVTYSNMEAFTSLDNFYFPMTKTTGGQDASFIMYLTPEESGNVYLYLNASSYYNTSAGEGTVTIEGASGMQTYNLDMDGIIDTGYQEGGELLTVRVSLNSDSKDTGTLYFYACMMDDEVFDEGYKKLKAGQLEITEFDDTVIKGTVDAEEDCTFFTSIPYDSGWQVMVDGKPAEYATYDADGILTDEDVTGKVIRIGKGLLGVNISAGEHEISLEYKVSGLSDGLVMSFAAVLIIALYFLLKRVGFIKRLTRKYAQYPERDDTACSTDIFLNGNTAYDDRRPMLLERPPKREVITPPAGSFVTEDVSDGENPEPPEADSIAADAFQQDAGELPVMKQSDEAAAAGENISEASPEADASSDSEA